MTTKRPRIITATFTVPFTISAFSSFKIPSSLNAWSWKVISQPPSGIISDKTNSYMRCYLQGNMLAVFDPCCKGKKCRGLTIVAWREGDIYHGNRKPWDLGTSCAMFSSNTMACWVFHIWLVIQPSVWGLWYWEDMSYVPLKAEDGCFIPSSKKISLPPTTHINLRIHDHL